MKEYPLSESLQYKSRLHDERMMQSAIERVQESGCYQLDKIRSWEWDNNKFPIPVRYLKPAIEIVRIEDQTLFLIRLDGIA